MKKITIFSIFLFLLANNLFAQQNNNGVYFKLGKNSSGAEFYGLMKNSTWIIEPKFLNHGEFSSLSGGLAWVSYSDGRINFIDKTGRVIIKQNIRAAFDFIGPYAMVSYDDPQNFDSYDDYYDRRKFSFIDKSGKNVENVKINYYKNNQSLKSTGVEINGKKVGEWVFVNRINYDDGEGYPLLNNPQFVIETYNQQGVLEGYYGSYFMSGGINPVYILQESGNFKNGKRHGTFTYYSGSGNPAYTEIWENGTFKHVKDIYDTNGNLVSSQGTGKITAYDVKGNVFVKANYEKGHTAGIKEWYHKNRKLKQKALYKYDANDPYGLRWEILEIYDKKGNPLPKGTLKNGNGTWINYDDNDKQTGVSTFQNGKKVGEGNLTKDIDKIYENVLSKENEEKVTAEKAIGNNSFEMSQGLYYFTTKEYTTALKSFTSAANKGEHEAMAYLGLMYYEGLGTTKDYKKAHEWVLKAANEGNAKATYQLAMLYYTGSGVAQSYAKAYEWYNVAAAKGIANADFQIGLLFEKGQGVDKNLQSAFNHFKTAADKGSLPGAYATGLYYLYGYAGEKNIPAALKYTLMAEKEFTNNPGYYNDLAYCYFESGELQTALNKLAVAMKVDPLYANGYDSMGEMYLKSGNRDAAIDFYKKAAQMGHKNAIKWCKDNNITY